MPAMPDRLALRAIRFHGFHGVSRAEARLGRPFEVDVEMAVDAAPAGQSDALRDAVDYAAVARLVLRTAERRRFRLLEALAEALARAVLRGFPVAEVTIRVRKMSPPVAVTMDHASVEVTRRR